MQQTLFKVPALVSIYLHLRAASQWRYNGCTLQSRSLRDYNELLAGSVRKGAVKAEYLERGRVCFPKCSQLLKLLFYRGITAGLFVSLGHKSSCHKVDLCLVLERRWGNPHGVVQVCTEPHVCLAFFFCHY